MMPGFFKDMPKRGAGVFICIVYRVTIRGRREVVHFLAKGRLRAYLRVRFWALVEDLTTPSHGGEVGIHWRITRLHPNTEVRDDCYETPRDRDCL